MQHYKFVNLWIHGFVFWCHEQVISLKSLNFFQGLQFGLVRSKNLQNWSKSFFRTRLRPLWVRSQIKSHRRFHECVLHNSKIFFLYMYQKNQICPVQCLHLNKISSFRMRYSETNILLYSISGAPLKWLLQCIKFR